MDACIALHGERLIADIGLDDIAGRAGVTVQTLLRHFGSRAGLLDAVSERAETVVVEERRAPVGDVREAVRVIVDHYEERGDQVLLMLAQESHEELMRRITERGRALHRAWVVEVFGPYLDQTADDDELTDLLAVASDVYVWKLLRRDRGLSRDETELRMRDLVSALLPPNPTDAALAPVH
jgi:AcrR family transcriptional regulator